MKRDFVIIEWDLDRHCVKYPVTFIKGNCDIVSNLENAIHFNSEKKAVEFWYKNPLRGSYNYRVMEVIKEENIVGSNYNLKCVYVENDTFLISLDKDVKYLYTRKSYTAYQGEKQ